MNKMYISFGALIIVILVGVFVWSSNKQTGESNPIKIGVITALTGDVAYWGEASKLGADLAKVDLAKEGINVEFVFDDAQLDPKMALDAVQKQVNADRVQAIYSEFNPAAIAVASFIKDKNILNIYDGAPVSPLAGNANIYKTFTDFKVGCANVSAFLKNRGVQRVGVIKSNMEYGQLCADGVTGVYGDSAYIETFNVGTTDFRTILTKLKSKNVGAIINASFTPDQLATLKNMRDLGMDITFVGTTDLDTPSVIEQSGGLFAKMLIFGLPKVSPEFVNKIKSTFPGRTITNEQGVALAYIHLTQMAKALSSCGSDLGCAQDKLNTAEPKLFVGFHGFKNHIADFDILIEEFKNGQFVPAK